MLGRIIGVIVVGLGVLIGVMAWRASDLPSPYLKVPDVADPGYDVTEIAGHMSAAVKYKTISFSQDAPTEAQAFLDFHAWFEATYPESHKVLEKEIVNEFSLLYRWKGRRDDLAPIGILGHMDVVPIEPGTEQNWTHPPFSGEIADGYVWGRGSMDNKSSVVLSIEAVERLVKAGFQPERDIYFAYGHDEEIAGPRGAKQIVATLKERGIMFDWILDEGFTILDGYLTFIDGPAAIIGVSEKGYLTLKLTARDPGGHSSSPRANTSVSMLASAIAKLHNNPFPMAMDARDRANLLAVAGEMPLMRRFAVANLWAFEKHILSELSEQPFTAAQYRTTTAATVFQGGSKDNILPQEATALVNFRIHPRNDIDDVVARTKKLVGENISVEIYETPTNPPAPSNIDGQAYYTLTDAIGAAFGPIAVAPSLVIGATDSRHYADITRETFRLTPITMTLEQFSGFHGTDERLTVETLGRSVRFFEELLKRGSAAP